ncbi:MAG TPA: ribonuclease H-like domain-containing protein [Thermoplasmata archaeon]|nr:ribonuclease H-like domain-containing protein [Thermoplasmata archaeon]
MADSATDVLRATFLHLPGVGPATEAELWRHGVLSWEQFRQRGAIPGIGEDRRRRLEDELAAAERAMVERNAGWFARRLPVAEHWRLYPEFRNLTAFLDIETTGLSPYEGIVTVVAVHTPGTTRSFVADDNLEELPAYLRRFQVLVTFNGIQFDVPFLEHRFPQLAVPPAHIDLRFTLRRLGLTGGLKRIEQVLALGDRTGVEGVYGIDAVRLWEQYRRGNAAALERLIQYNRADTVNLEPLLEFAVRELKRRLWPWPSPPGRGWTGDVAVLPAP